ncbi:esterase/lipase family protein [Haloferula sargassicola]|uniref:Lipase n=1 Tax=Haloferula sargassicola TaxID=490096 RepID=A0ABP9UNX2_9BACT
MSRVLLFLVLGGLALAEPQPAGWTTLKVDRVVFVHGIWQNEATCFGRLRRTLEERGVECIAPSLSPADGREGLEPMAQQLKDAIDLRLPPKSRFAVIAFSMGGLIARTYLQDLGGAARCQALVTLATPHHGTRAAFFHYGKGAAEMRPGSVFLNELEAGQHRLGDMPLLSYRTPMDLIIVPSTSSVWDRAVNVEVPVAIHPAMTTSRRVIDDLLTRFDFPQG